MNCTYCNKPIVLVPSATERAERYGGKPSDYTKLFTYHGQCHVKARNKAVMELIYTRRTT